MVKAVRIEGTAKPRTQQMTALMHLEKVMEEIPPKISLKLPILASS